MQQAQTTTAASLSQAALPLQVLMIGLGSEIFAVETDIVREIIDPVAVTRVAGARNFLPALINVRGNIIPLADLRLRFGMAQRPETPDTRIVVVEIEIDGDPVALGMVADKVYEVTEISQADAQQMPRLGMHWKPDFIRFIAKWNDEFVIVPDLGKILA